MRADLRLSDLQTEDGKSASKLMNAKIPVTMVDAIHSVAQALECTITAAVVALLNEGLAIFESRRHEFPAPLVKRRRRGRRAMLVAHKVYLVAASGSLGIVFI